MILAVAGTRAIRGRAHGDQGATTDELVKAHLNLSDEVIASLPQIKRHVVR
ncbi:MAG: hypothetical protein ACXVUL_15360 [Solirubrobacteraceae bacterium]